MTDDARGRETIPDRINIMSINIDAIENNTSQAIYLQRALNNLGYHLTVDGKIGKKTVDTLYNAQKKLTHNHTYTPVSTATPPSTPTTIAHETPLVSHDAKKIQGWQESVNTTEACIQGIYGCLNIDAELHKNNAAGRMAK